MQEQQDIGIQAEVEAAMGQLQIANIAQAKTIKRLSEENAALKGQIAEQAKDTKALDEIADADLRKMPVDGKR